MVQSSFLKSVTLLFVWCVNKSDPRHSVSLTGQKVTVQKVPQLRFDCKKIKIKKDSTDGEG